MALFTRGASASIGSDTASPSPVTLYTVPVAKKSVITGVTVANKSSFNLPIDVYVQQGSDVYYIANKVRVAPGESKGLTGPEKIVLTANDVIKADAPRISTNGDSFTVVASIYEDVS